jgi:hypothetical protein
VGVFLIGLLLFGQHGESPGDPGFPWGQGYGDWRVQKSAMILKQVPGEKVIVSKNDLEFEFSFHLKKKIRDVRTSVKEEGGKKKAVFEELILDAAEPVENARLYAVAVKYPKLPLTEDLKESIRKMGAQSIPESDQFSIDLPSTLIQITCSRKKDKRYLERIVFISKVYSAVEKEDADLLKKEADSRIKNAVDERQQEMVKSPPQSWMRSEIIPRNESSLQVTPELWSETP